MAGILVGATTSGLLGGTAASEQAALEAIVGKQSVRRCYANGSYTTSPYFMQSFLGAVDVDTTNHVSIRATHVSWDPDATALNTENPSGFNPTPLLTYLAAGQTGSALSAYGTETQANLTWLLSAPSYADVIWTPWHEADLNYNQGSGNYNYATFAAFKTAFNIVADMVHTIGNFYSSNWKTCLVLAAYAWKGNSGTNEDPDNFFTDTSHVDLVGIDAYNEGSLTAARWDSLQVALGYPADSNEATAYQAVYGGTNGHKTSDAAGSWANGFLGWCEARGVDWVVAEWGTIRNVDGLSPTWPSTTASKAQWITDAWTFIEAYNANPAHNAKCYAVEYFYRGRTYSGSDYLANTIHLTPSGTQQVCMGTITTAQLTTLLAGNTTGDLRWNSSAGHVYRWSGSAWTDQGAAADESWELWWNEDGSGLHGGNSAESAWAAVTASQAAAIRLGAVILTSTVDSATAAITAPVALTAAAVVHSALTANIAAPVTLGATAVTVYNQGSSGITAPVKVIGQIGGPLVANIRIGALQVSSSVIHPAANLIAAVTVLAAAQQTAAAGSLIGAPVTLLANTTLPPVIRIGAVRLLQTDQVKVWNGNAWVDELATSSISAPVNVVSAASTVAVIGGTAGLTAPVHVGAAATVLIPPNPLSSIVVFPVNVGAPAPVVTQGASSLILAPIKVLGTITGITPPAQDIPISLWDGTQEIPLTIDGLWDGAGVVELSLSWSG